jgi:hypothetical protein
MMHKEFVGITVMICMVLSMSPIAAYSIETPNNYNYTPGMPNFSLDTSNLAETITIDKDENELLKTKSSSNINEPNNSGIMYKGHGTPYKVLYYTLKTIAIIGMILGIVGGVVALLSWAKLLPDSAIKAATILGMMGALQLGLDWCVIY